jgi:hypothetical protein
MDSEIEVDRKKDLHPSTMDRQGLADVPIVIARLGCSA